MLRLLCAGTIAVSLVADHSFLERVFINRRAADVKRTAGLYSRYRINVLRMCMAAN